MGNLAVVILTKNEEQHMQEVIANAQKCSSDIYILDSGSTDRTVEIAEASGAQIFFRAWDNDFAKQRNFLLDKIDCSWILYLDADERMDETLQQEILSAVSSNKSDVYYEFKRVNAKKIDGEIFSSITQVDRVSRLFRRTEVNWVGSVHEHPECIGEKRLLQGTLFHFTYSGWKSWLKKMDLYTDIWSEEKFKNNKRVSSLKIFLEGTFALVKSLIFKGNIFRGGEGLITAYQHTFYTVTKYGKLYELQKFKGLTQNETRKL